MPFAMNGRYRESACGLQLDCLPRSVVFHPPGEEHAIVAGDASLRCFIVELDAHEMRRRYDAAAPATLLKIDSGPMAAVLTNLYGEFRHADACSSPAIQGLILQLLAALSRTHRTDAAPLRTP